MIDDVAEQDEPDCGSHAMSPQKAHHRALIASESGHHKGVISVNASKE
jgi:hypothetical protein